MPRLLALPAPACEADKESVVVCGIDLRRRALEPAGHAFHECHERPLLEQRSGKRRPEPTRAASDDEAEPASQASWKKKKKEGSDKRSALKLSPHLAGVDLYALLEVSEAASLDQIKKQYRKMALQHHPDKHGDGAKAEAGSGLSEKDMLFVKIQEAYEVLSDQAKRRQYDSSLDFDDDVPDEEDISSGGFYAVLTPVFRRNSRWSTRHPVPELGDEGTDISKVHKFYDFWFEFDSWRDFSMHDEFNLDDAEFREERRWMDRQNQKIRKKYQDAERKRILRLVEMAERLDPRIRAEREEKEAQKRREKERRAQAKQQEEDAKRQREEAKRLQEEKERAEREERERAEREQRKQDKQLSKTLRQRLKKCIQSKCSPSTAEMEEIQEFCLSLEPQELEDLCALFEASKSPQALLGEQLGKWHQRNADAKEAEEKRKQEARRLEEQQKASGAKNTAATPSAPWSVEELGVLAKGLQKFPGGLGGRWALITQHLQSSGFPRAEQEVVAKTKELAEGQSLRSMGARVADSFQAGAAKAKAAPVPKDSKPAPEATEEKAPASVEWTSEQQKALEAALQKHPASLEKNERWRLIAEAVPGKTKAQCVERFKFLREQLSKQKPA